MDSSVESVQRRVGNVNRPLSGFLIRGDFESQKSLEASFMPSINRFLFEEKKRVKRQEDETLLLFVQKNEFTPAEWMKSLATKDEPSYNSQLPEARNFRKQMAIIMKAIGIFALVIISSTLAVLAQTNSNADSSPKRTGRVSLKYDKSKDVTTVRLKQMIISRLKHETESPDDLPLHQMDLEMWFTYPGTGGNAKVGDVTMRFHAVGSNYIFLRSQQIIVALNREVKGQDRAFGLGMTNYRSTAPKFNTVYEEFMEISVPAEAIVKISKAVSAEIYVGPIGYRLSSDQQQAIAEMASMLPQTPSKTVTKDKVGL